WLLSSGPTFHASRTNGQVLTSIAWTLFLFALGNLLLALRDKGSGHTLSLNSLCVVPGLILVYLFPQVSAPWLRYDPSGKTIARELIDKQIPLDHLYIARMPRGQEYSLNFYLRREVAAW